MAALGAVEFRLMYTRADRYSSLWQDCHDIIPVVSQAGCFRRLDYAFPLPGIDREIRLVYFSDLHWDFSLADYFAPLAAALTAASADYLIFGGDLFGLPESAVSAWEWLAALPARYGRMAVLGNREAALQWKPATFWREAYARYGYRCLINECWQGEVGHPCFCGLDDYRYGQPVWGDCRSRSASGVGVVTLSHNPDAVAEAGGEFVGHLVLCGHTHGGQLNFPWLGPLYTSSHYGRQFLQGMRVRPSDGALCHISTGVGASGFGLYRRRFRCPPQFSCLRLCPSAGSTAVTNATI